MKKNPPSLYRQSTRLALAMSCGFAACGPHRNTVAFNYEDFFAVGESPETVAASMIETGEREGFLLVEERRHERFVAIELANPDRGERRVRIATQRGVPWVFDSSATAADAVVRLRRMTIYDLEGDGSPEVVLERSRPEANLPSCLLVVTVKEDGQSPMAPTDTSHLLANECIEDLRDADYDGALDAIVFVRPVHGEHNQPAESVRTNWEIPVAFKRDSEGIYRYLGMPSALLARELEGARRCFQVASTSNARKSCAVRQAMVESMNQSSCSQVVARAIDLLNESVSTAERSEWSSTCQRIVFGSAPSESTPSGTSSSEGTPQSATQTTDSAPAE